LCKLDLPHIEIAYSADFEVFVNHLSTNERRISFLRQAEWLTVGVLRCVLDSTISKKSFAVGTGAMGFMPRVAMAVGRAKASSLLFGPS
jgi:hypothetical protein